MSRLEARRLTRRYGPLAALQEVSFSLPAGSFTALVGPSGAGKTTLLRLIAGLEEPDAGQLWLDGREATRMPPHRRGIGMVFQDLALFPHMTVRQNVEFACPGQPERATELLALAGWEGRPEAFPSQLSGGQRQRVALARALAGRPRLLLLDEPFLNLDPPARRRLLAELGRVKLALGLTVLYVTHHLQDALMLADQLLFLSDGQVELQGPLPRVLEQSASPAFDAFIGGGSQGWPAAPVAGVLPPAVCLARPDGPLAVQRRLYQHTESLLELQEGGTTWRFLAPLEPGRSLWLESP